MKSLFIILILPLLFRCGKKEDPYNETTKVEVKEFKSLAPVKNAKVSALQCYEPTCNWIRTQNDFYSDEKGICYIPNIIFNKTNLFVGLHPDYHPNAILNNLTLSLTRIAWINLRLIPTTSLQGQLLIHVRSESNMDSVISPVNFHTPKDTTVLLKAFGNQVNQVSWTIYANGAPIASGKLSQDVPRDGTVNASLYY